MKLNNYYFAKPEIILQSLNPSVVQPYNHDLLANGLIVRTQVKMQRTIYSVSKYF
jgi:hypothetical protein